MIQMSTVFSKGSQTYSSLPFTSWSIPMQTFLVKVYHKVLSLLWHWIHPLCPLVPRKYKAFEKLGGNRKTVYEGIVEQMEKLTFGLNFRRTPGVGRAFNGGAKGTSAVGDWNMRNVQIWYGTKVYYCNMKFEIHIIGVHMGMIIIV